MYKGAYNLSGLVRSEMGLNVLSGDVFIFISRRAIKVKLLQWDHNVFSLYEKGFEKGTFVRPSVSDPGHYTISAQQLQHILQGIILRGVRHKSRYRQTG